MKHTMRRVLALLLVAGVLFALPACSLFEEEPTKAPPSIIDPLPAGNAAAIDYYNKLLPLLEGVKSYAVATSYSVGDVETESKVFKAAVPELKKLLTKGLDKEEKDLAFGADAYPLLRNALQAADVLEIQAQTQLEVKLKEALPEVQSDYENGYIEKKTLEQTLEEYGQTKLGLKDQALGDWVAKTMKDEAETLRLYTIQAKIGDADQAKYRYQLDITLQPGLAPEAAERYIRPEDKGAILKELAKAKGYLLLTDYEKIPQVLQPDPEKPDEEPKPTYTINCLVDNTSNRLTEITLVARYEVSAQAQGTGNLADEGTFAVTAPIEKTVKITFDWPEIKAGESATAAA